MHVRLGRERMHARELRPRHGRHLGRRVELHGARAQRDHAAIERVVAVGELLEVAHHRRLGPVRVEDRVREELLDAVQPGRHAGERLGIRERERALALRARPEDRPREARTPRRRPRGRRRSSSRRPRCRPSRRRPRTAGSRVRRARSITRREGPGVATRMVSKNESERVQTVRPQPGGERLGLLGDIRGDRAEPLGPVVHRVHRGHHGQQHLRRADVRRGLLAADVLLARLQRQAVGGVARGILRDAHEASRQLPLEALRAPPCSRRGVRRSRAGTPKRWVVPTATSAPNEPGERSRVRARRSAAATTSAPATWAASTTPDGSHTLPRGARILHQHAEERRREAVAPWARSSSTSSMPTAARAMGQQRLRLRQRVGVDDEDVRRRLRGAPRHEHALDHGGRLVEHRGVRRREPGEVGHHGLEVDERLEAALRDLGLVRRVGGVPGRVLEHVARDHGRRERVVVAEADHRAGGAVLRGQRPQLGERLGLGRRRRDVTRRARLRHGWMPAPPPARGRRRCRSPGRRASCAGLRHPFRCDDRRTGPSFGAARERDVGVAVEQLGHRGGVDRSLTSQPSPNGSALTSDGSSTTASLTSTTSPVSGA